MDPRLVKTLQIRNFIRVFPFLIFFFIILLWPATSFPRDFSCWSMNKRAPRLNRSFHRRRVHLVYSGRLYGTMVDTAGFFLLYISVGDTIHWLWENQSERCDRKLINSHAYCTWFWETRTINQLSFFYRVTAGNMDRSIFHWFTYKSGWSIFTTCTLYQQNIYANVPVPISVD